MATTFVSKKLAEYAKANRVNVEIVERQKVIWLYVPVVTGTQQKVYFPYDNDLAQGIVTGIRCLYISEIGAPVTAPAQYTGPNGTKSVGNPVAFAQYVATFLDHKGNYFFTQFPIANFLQSANLNQDLNTPGIRTLMRIAPHNCYLEYFNVSNTRGDIYLPFVFTYHAITEQ